MNLIKNYYNNTGKKVQEDKGNELINTFYHYF